MFHLTIVMLIGTLSCAEDQSPVTTDISVNATQDLITWSDTDDLNQKIEGALFFDYGQALESEVNKTIGFNTDTTLLIARIFVKSEYDENYFDPNISNNTLTVPLRKITSTGAVVLSAGGPGDTYELITSILAPGANPVEAPDCNHAEFGRHIDEVFDNELGANVFRFHIHVEPDNDRCINFDRQRNEIKSYNQSPNNLLGVEGETVIYSWKFKLPVGFQSSPNFTHIHQLKSVGGEFDSMPMYTLTTRKSNPDILQLRYAEVDKQITLAEVSLEPFLGIWVEVTEKITYGYSGSYELDIKTISDDLLLFEYSNENIINWRENGEFVRPKWGIYRSLINAQDLRDETMLFADFSIEEILEG